MEVGGGKKLEASQHTRPRPSGITQVFSYIVHPPPNATQTTRTLFLSFHSKSFWDLTPTSLGNIGVDWGSLSRRATGP